MNPWIRLSRREMLARSGLGLGMVYLDWLLAADAARGEELAPARAQHERFDLAARPSHFPPQAQAVIQLVQNGGPSQMDLFDPKPELSRRSGQTHSEKVETFQKGNTDKLFGSPLKFQRHGRSGMELAEVIPHIGSLADELCLVRSMFSEHNNHSEALIMLQTGKIFPGRPVLGSWISYALGTENQNLPAYVVLRDPAGYNTTGSLTWANGWLPVLYRGTEFNSVGSPLHNLRPSQALPEGAQQDSLELIARLNEEHLRRNPSETELEARVRNYELAARMQLDATAALDLSRETAATRAMYGLDDPLTAGYGTRCLMARRLVEAGVRFVQIHPEPFQPWDTHNQTKSGLENICRKTDRPCAALVRDLAQRGLLDTTIVLWSGEFGRLPVAQGSDGRDHNRNAFSLILAGGGFKSGYIHGATDELGYRAVEGRVSVPDLHATILHQLGLDHRRVVFAHHGRPERPTDPEVSGARVVAELFESPARV